MIYVTYLTKLFTHLINRTSLWLPCLMLAIVTSIFYYPIVFGSQVFFFGDTLTQRLPSMVFWKQQILAGQIPLWNPYIFAGVPHLADLSTNTLSPFNLIYLIIPDPITALSFLVVVVTFISAVFTYLYLRFHFNHLSSLFGSLVFAFSGTTLAASNDINSLQGIVFIPILLWTAERLIRHLSLRSIGVLSMALALQFVSGHPQYSYYSWFLVSVYLLCFLPYPIRYRLRIVAFSLTLFVMISCIQLIPFLELSSQTFRPHEAEFAGQNSLSIIDVPRLLVANVYGNWKSGTSWGPNSSLEVGRATTEGYVGVVPILLAMIGVVKAKDTYTRFFILMGITALILSFGPSTPLYQLFHRWLPLFNNFRSPIRILSLYTFSIAYLAAAGLNYLDISKNAKFKS